MNNLYKIAISGKANVGKDTFAKLLAKYIQKKINKELAKSNHSPIKLEKTFMAFADPLKEMALIMFPKTEKDDWFGASANRSKIIPNAFKNGQPLTHRQVLLDIGTELGRSYNQQIWIDNFENRLNDLQLSEDQIIIAMDIRFRNEFDYLKKQNFYTIRLLREESSNINHSSETDQILINNNEFDMIISNGGTLEDLKNEAKRVGKTLIKQGSFNNYQKSLNEEFRE